MAKKNIESVISNREALEKIANSMCCKKIFSTPHKQCFYCKEFKGCKITKCQECAWSIPNDDIDVCLPWLAHDLLNSLSI